MIHFMKNTAFTLIELLIVVAIIGILAAIAVPNFLNAQMRAKVARAVSNMQTVETGLEMYFLDKNSYPRWAWDGWGNLTNHYTGFRDLTTPVAYVTSQSAFVNPFKSTIQTGHNVSDGRELDPFFELGTFQYENESYNYNEFPRNCWLLESSGPDSADDYNGHSYPARGVIFQPSNGLRSRGDIFRAGGVKIAPWAAKLTY